MSHLINRFRFKLIIWGLVCVFSLNSGLAYAETYEDPEDRGDMPLRPYFEPPNGDLYPRNYIVPPLLSFLLPGFDQWVERQYKPAGLYTAGAFGGAILLSNAKQTTRDNRYRDFAWQVYFTAGGLSLYHSFRTAVATRIPKGDFPFLSSIPETPNELLLAPVNFKYLERWTTLLPLALAVGAFFLVTPSNSSGPISANLDDGFYAGTVGYMTGIGEEAMFRGWLLPILYNASGDQKITLGISSLIFALGHGLKVKHFVTAFFFGLYSGWLTQENKWSIGEVTFIHSWWDIMAFAADYVNRRQHAFLRLPTISFQF